LERREHASVQWPLGVADNDHVGASLISRLTEPEYRGGRVRVQKALIIASLLTFMASLFLPAVSVTIEEIGSVNVGNGVTCLVMSGPYYATNAFLYTGALWCWVLRRRRGPAMGAMLSIVGVLSLAFAAMAPTMVEQIYPLAGEGHATFLVGFYAWLVAHLLMTLAIALPLWGDSQGEELRQLRGELEALERKWVPEKKAA
jgi:hypothetical protein